MLPQMSNYHQPQPIPFYFIKCRITEKHGQLSHEVWAFSYRNKQINIFCLTDSVSVIIYMLCRDGNDG